MKIAYDLKWVRVRNLMNKRFHAARPCSIGLGLKCAPVWYSIRPARFTILEMNR